MISCKKDRFGYGDVLIVGTYTPGSWGEQFYYDELQGKRSNQEVKVLNTHLRFPQTGDSLILKEIRKKREFIYHSSDLQEIIDRNNQLELTVFYRLNNDTTTLEKTFLMRRYKHSYSTGTFPHS
ncbi:MAG: hypothetical protein K0Q66_2425 [Chitinophagaceae bacterium]|nr:hypothetical protein [Chitinophagaceae bacterium]